jgi:hypothetical protein
MPHGCTRCQIQDELRRVHGEYVQRRIPPEKATYLPRSASQLTCLVIEPSETRRISPGPIDSPAGLEQNRGSITLREIWTANTKYIRHIDTNVTRAVARSGRIDPAAGSCTPLQNRAVPGTVDLSPLWVPGHGSGARVGARFGSPTDGLRVWAPASAAQRIDPRARAVRRREISYRCRSRPPPGRRVQPYLRVPCSRQTMPAHAGRLMARHRRECERPDSRRPVRRAQRRSCTVESVPRSPPIGGECLFSRC